MTSVHDFGAIGDGVHDDAPCIQKALDAPWVTDLEFVAGKTYRLASSCATVGNDRPYLWIRRPNLNVDLHGATLSVDPIWGTATPATAKDAYPLIGDDGKPVLDPHTGKPEYVRKWKGTTAAVFNVGTTEREVANISISNGNIAGYGEQVEWMPADLVATLGLSKLHQGQDGRRADVVGVRVGFGSVHNLRLHGLKIADMYDGVQLAGAGDAAVGDIEITDCRFSRCHREACAITGVHDALVAGCHADSCGFPMASTNPKYDWFGLVAELSGPAPVGAFHVETHGGQLVRDLILEHNLVTNCQHGFVVSRDAACEARSVKRVCLDRNAAWLCKNCGILLRGVQDWALTNNWILLCGSGIYVENKCLGPAASLGRVDRNVCRNTTVGHGIAVVWYRSSTGANGEATNETVKYRDSDAEPLWVVVSNNVVRNSAGTGILLSDAQGAVCDRNLVRSSSKVGIHANLTPGAEHPRSDLLISTNRCVSNGAEGILGEYLSYARLTGNECLGNSLHGIRLDPADPADVVEEDNLEFGNGPAFTSWMAEQ